MSRKLTQPIEYTYSNSFRNMYSQTTSPEKTLKLNTHRQQPLQGTIVLQYESAQSRLKDRTNQSPQRKAASLAFTNNSQFTLQSYSKRLHSNQKKYSFSVFVKQAKKKDQQRKSNAKTVQKRQLTLEMQRQKIKGKKKLDNSAIKTLYENFRNAETSPVRKLSEGQHDVWKMLTSGNNVKNNGSNHMTGRGNYDKGTKNQDNSAKVHFFKTLPYNKRLRSRQDENIKPSSSRKLNVQSTLSPQPHYATCDSFLRIEKCLPENNDETFLKQCEDFKKVLLKQRLLKESKKAARAETDFIKLLNKSKDEGKFTKYVSGGRESKYVAEMRDVKKIKKRLSGMSDEEDGGGEGIAPW